MMSSAIFAARNVLRIFFTCESNVHATGAPRALIELHVFGDAHALLTMAPQDDLDASGQFAAPNGFVT